MCQKHPVASQESSWQSELQTCASAPGDKTFTMVELLQPTCHITPSLLTPSNRTTKPIYLWFRFFAWINRRVINSFCICISICSYFSFVFIRYCDQCACIFVCPRPNFTKFSIHVTFGRGLTLLWQQCDTLCTSGLWMTLCFHIIERMGENQRWSVCVVEFSRVAALGTSLPSPTASCLYFLFTLFINLSTTWWWFKIVKITSGGIQEMPEPRRRLMGLRLGGVRLSLTPAFPCYYLSIGRSFLSENIG